MDVSKNFVLVPRYTLDDWCDLISDLNGKKCFDYYNLALLGIKVL